MARERIAEITHCFLSREKKELTPEDLAKCNMDEIKAWAWCTGMGSDALACSVMSAAAFRLSGQCLCPAGIDLSGTW